MKKKYFVILLVIIFLVSGCTKNSINPLSKDRVQVNIKELSECEKAGGEITTMHECDGSINDWCVIVKEKEECYAEDIKNGKCPEQISPRTLCDTEELGQ